MSEEIRIIDDYLPSEDYELIHNYFMGYMDNGNISNSCVWTYVSGISTKDDGYSQMVHQLYLNHTIISPAFPLITPILIKEDILGLIRVKANLLLKTSDLIVYDHAFHTDIGSDKNLNVMTSIYYINTNNGYTLFEDGTKVESIGNRFVTFPCNLKHTGTTCTDQQNRLLINFNYYATLSRDFS